MVGKIVEFVGRSRLIGQIARDFSVGQVALSATAGNDLGKFDLSDIHVGNPPAKSISLVTQVNALRLGRLPIHGSRDSVPLAGFAKQCFQRFSFLLGVEIGFF